MPGGLRVRSKKKEERETITVEEFRRKLVESRAQRDKERRKKIGVNGKTASEVLVRLWQEGDGAVRDEIKQGFLRGETHHQVVVKVLFSHNDPAAVCFFDDILDTNTDEAVTEYVLDLVHDQYVKNNLSARFLFNRHFDHLTAFDDMAITLLQKGFEPFRVFLRASYWARSTRAAHIIEHVLQQGRYRSLYYQFIGNYLERYCVLPDFVNDQLARERAAGKDDMILYIAKYLHYIKPKKGSGSSGIVRQVGGKIAAVKHGSASVILSGGSIR